MSDDAAVGPTSVESQTPAESQAAGRHMPKHPVLERLYAEPQRFELFQAVRLLFAEAVEEAASVGAPAPPIIGSRESHGAPTNGRNVLPGPAE